LKKIRKVTGNVNALFVRGGKNQQSLPVSFRLYF